MKLHIRTWMPALLPAFLLAMAAGAAQAATVGQVDTFQDGTTNGWDTGANSPNPPVQMPGGGPAGLADGYLLATANGAGAGGKLVLFSGPQWSGNYLSGALTSISLDLKNFGTTELDLHLALIGAGTAYTTNAVVLNPGGGWVHATFFLDADALTGTTAVLGNVSSLHLYHGGASPVNVVASLGLDNITAVPEPGTGFIVAAGLAVVVAAHRRRRHALRR